MKLGGILVLAAALVLTGCAPAAPPVDPDIQAKADTFSAKIEADMEARFAAEDEAKLIKLTFPDDRPLRLLFAGDSLAGGFFASAKDKGFTQLVRQSLSQSGPVEEFRGEQAHATLSTVGGLVNVPAGLDLAIVELGTNDIKAKTDPATFAEQYAGLLAKIKADSPNAAILCASVWQSDATTKDVYNRAIQEQCQTAGGKYADISVLFEVASNRGPAGVETWVGTSDNFHPNDKGHQAISDLLLGQIEIS